MAMVKQVVIMLVLGLFLRPSDISFAGEAKKATGRVKGGITIEGAAFSNGYVSFYLPGEDITKLSTLTYWKTPAYIAKITADKRFDVQVPEGIYFVAAILTNRTWVGPPEDDDYVSLFDDKRSPLRIEVRKDSTIDIGTLKTIPFKSLPRTEKDITAVKGVILDTQGKPVDNVYIGAHLTMNHPRPDYISRRSDKNGNYELRLPAGGTYFLSVRYKLGLTQESEYYISAENDKNQIAIKSGEVLKKNFTVRKVNRENKPQ